MISDAYHYVTVSTLQFFIDMSLIEIFMIKILLIVQIV